MITGYGKGNPALSNLPRKINFALSPSRDDFPHVFINDVGLQAVQHPETKEVIHLHTDEFSVDCHRSSKEG